MPESIPDEALHHRLRDGDPTASALITERHLVTVVKRLRTRYPNLADPAFVDEATHTAFINYFRNPDTYDPTKSSLTTFLHMAARSDLLNLLKQEKRRSEKQPISLDLVELSTTRAEYLLDNTANPDQLDFEQPAISVEIRRVLSDPLDQRIFALMVDGERRTAVYAAVLSIASLPLTEQEVIVKRHKDRIKKRLQRARIWTNDT